MNASSRGRVVLEICVDTATGLDAAVEGGADRIELCSALEIGGLTPSAGLMAIAGALPCSVHAMIRPRSGGFVFDEGDLATMLRDVDAARAAGLAGVVLGASRSDASLDAEMLARLVAHAEGLSVTLHRAFDLVPDPLAALRTAIDLGFDRILTSGGALTAQEGGAVLAELVEAAGGRIAVLAGSGISAGNVAELLDRTAVREVHASCRMVRAKADPRAAAFGFQNGSRRETDAAAVAALRRELDRWQAGDGRG
ncbi:copper homeostasis protein [Faunimonas pinastri]|uniref:PF03932 family protein CutC n=1 Tax=Faunimonas pinastri TaxID=1855383 RepID=A0A1H9PDP5_9HYPH|nr:copper homeostasis protein CutC [Faunimonas pinastri]SER45693.1 copper homeostasis protein [Faunimonas pinastri]